MNRILQILLALGHLFISSCSCAIFHEEYFAGRPLTKIDEKNVERIILDSSFSVSALSAKSSTIESKSGKVVFHDVLCPLISASFYFPGDKKWYENNRKKVADLVSQMKQEGLVLERRNFGSLPAILMPQE